MTNLRSIHWRDFGMWLGCFEEYPGCLTHGESLEEIEERLRRLYRGLASGPIAGVRKVAELSV
ncbi:MAG: hypothetical protein C0504_15910 [Candidatus Solibacter sp.]|nr:hypothetical protein [Candidatus Solibacter sp.]